MNIRKTLSTILANKSLLSTAVLAAVFCFTAMPRLNAESYDHCQRRIRHAEHDLHKAIDRHGRHSRQAEHERAELHEARERCWNENHRWWDDHEHRWHQEHDWDDRDHDRD
jgi:hypothetical protein